MSGERSIIDDSCPNCGAPFLEQGVVLEPHGDGVLAICIACYLAEEITKLGNQLLPLGVNIFPAIESLNKSGVNRQCPTN